MNEAYGTEYQGVERRLVFNCSCGKGWQYMVGKKGEFEIVCTGCNIRKPANRTTDKQYVRDWVGNG